jgi:outer membrane protein TolC
MRGLLYLAILISYIPSAWGKEPLPSPLSLEQALAIADQDHPERSLADAALAQALASRRQAQSSYDTQLTLTGELRAIEPSEISIYQTHNDSLARLNLSKQLYDFGRTARAEEAADASLVSSKWRLKSVRQQRRLEVMQRFYAVLLSDLKHARDNEALAIAFIRFDRASNRHEMGKVSDVDLLELESEYQQVRRELTASANQQRITRSQLAISLNRPTDLPAEVETPEIELEEMGDEFEPWVDKVLTGNLELKALKADTEAARKQLLASEAADNPVLRGELEAATYERELGGRNPLTAALVIEVPLYAGSRVDAEIAQQRALLQQREAQLQAYQLQLHQQVLDLWLAMEKLNVESQALMVSADFRDLALDRSRTLYDLDMQADLGDSMTQIADIQWRMAQNKYDRLILQARLKALSGSLLPEGEREE